MRPNLLYPLFTDLQYLKGIGPALSKRFEKLCGHKVWDLLSLKPTSFIDRRICPPIMTAPEGEIASFEVEIEQHKPPPKKGLPYRVLCRNESGFLNLVFFHAYPDSLLKSLPVGEKRIVSGVVENFGEQKQISHPDIIAKPEDREKVLRLEPQYPLSAGITQKKIRATISQSLATLPDLPEWQDSPQLGFKDALLELHSPENEDDIEGSLQRLAYDELLAGQLAQGLVYQQTTKKSGAKIQPRQENLIEKLITALPFKLTSGQDKAIDEIFTDMQSGNRMFRLLQGDVGCGKTAVALVAMVAAVANKKQAVLMMPTTLLATQQLNWIKSVTQNLDIRTELLTGNEKGAKRADILKNLKSGEIDILVGTHALFQDWVEFADLGLIVIDEQHRFGVLQRLKLSQKNEQAHILLMTATPIPRTLTIAFFGEMDISRITEKPAERLPIETLVMPFNQSTTSPNPSYKEGKYKDFSNPSYEEGDTRKTSPLIGGIEGGNDKIISALRRAISNGEKIFWICPLVSESEKTDLAAAEERYKFFSKIFGNKVGLVHGKMKEQQKNEVLQKFINGEHQLLIATTVIEVGIDVRDATIMFIEHAERFGLSQLHQLRGRVGRGDKKSTCILLYAGKLGQASEERLKVMKKYNDGFKIAEEDLKIRGAGEIMGTRQSGFKEFKFAEMPEQQEDLFQAREEARKILQSDPKLLSARGKNLRLLLSLFEYDETMEYISAG
ncbi:MAG: ATP-dependent DNA helicase RecG [Alphaproteobacteria bacterium CG11_big_fil_rev_8_21_14_0_20_44_7]|nr:MAG: ATP-dependent DNA helicase RecG [Alphaproteobacteria bacterium CG11_big_fil_rev_8_21_14_0_20_44_7]